MEDRARHQRTVAAGDFNMNPDELGMVEAEGLHAVISRNLASTIHGLQRRTHRPCFFNPSWGCLGDRDGRPPGTYYFSNPQDDANSFWNTYDQVLVRPALMDRFAGPEVLDGDGTEPLVTRTGRPRRAVFADHLPITFALDI